MQAKQQDYFMTLANRYTSSRHSVYNVSYHIVFCTKYRRKVLIDGAEARLKELFLEKALELDIQIEDMEVMPDHVDLFVKSKPVYMIHFVINQLKGYASPRLRKEFPHIRTRLPSLWTRSYFVETIGHISESMVKRYIENQKKI